MWKNEFFAKTCSLTGEFKSICGKWEWNFQSEKQKYYVKTIQRGREGRGKFVHLQEEPRMGDLPPKNIERGRNSSLWVTSSHRQHSNWGAMLGFGNLWFYTFKNNLCLEKSYLVYLVKKLQQSIHKMWKNSNMISQLNQWKLCPRYPHLVHNLSCWWQHKSCY